MQSDGVRLRPQHRHNMRRSRPTGFGCHPPLRCFPPSLKLLLYLVEKSSLPLSSQTKQQVRQITAALSLRLASCVSKHEAPEQAVT